MDSAKSQGAPIEENIKRCQQELEQKALIRNDPALPEHACTCTYCLYASQPLEKRRVLDERNDKMMGWPEHLALYDELTEYPLRLNGYSAKSRNEIIHALFTLGKHGIRLGDLMAGCATGNEIDEAEEEQLVQKGIEELRKPPSEQTDMDFDLGECIAHCTASMMKLVRVGRNFVDFEVPKHHVDPAYFYTANSEMSIDTSEGLWPEMRVREMSVWSLSSPPSETQRDYCVYRLFANNRKPTSADKSWYGKEGAKHPAIARAIDELSQTIFDNRLCRGASGELGERYGHWVEMDMNQVD